MRAGKWCTWFAAGAIAFMHGVASAQVPITKPVLSGDVSPIEELSVPTSDGGIAIAMVRRPPGPGPYPVVMFSRGGLEPFPLDLLRTWATHETMIRFLAAGYVIVSPLTGVGTKTHKIQVLSGMFSPC